MSDSFLLTVVAAGVGAAIAHYATKTIDTRFASKERRRSHRAETIDELEATLEETTKLIQEYWSANASDLGAQAAIMEAQISTGLHNVNLLIIDAFDRHPEELRLTQEEWSALYRIATGGEFQSPTRPADIQVLRACIADALTLKRGILRRRIAVLD